GTNDVRRLREVEVGRATLAVDEADGDGRQLRIRLSLAADVRRVVQNLRRRDRARGRDGRDGRRERGHDCGDDDQASPSEALDDGWRTHTYIPPSADLRHAVEVRVRPRCADDVRWFAASSDGSRRRSLSAHSFGRTIERHYPPRDESVNGNVDDPRRPTEDSSGPLLEHPA